MALRLGRQALPGGFVRPRDDLDPGRSPSGVLRILAVENRAAPRLPSETLLGTALQYPRDAQSQSEIAAQMCTIGYISPTLTPYPPSYTDVPPSPPPHPSPESHTPSPRATPPTPSLTGQKTRSSAPAHADAARALNPAAPPAPRPGSRAGASAPAHARSAPPPRHGPQPSSSQNTPSAIQGESTIRTSSGTETPIMAGLLKN